MRPRPILPILALALTATLVFAAEARDSDKSVATDRAAAQASSQDRTGPSKREMAAYFDARYAHMIDPATDGEEANFISQHIEAEITDAKLEKRLNKNYQLPGPI